MNQPILESPSALARPRSRRLQLQLTKVLDAPDPLFDPEELLPELDLAFGHLWARGPRRGPVPGGAPASPRTAIG
jgi:hypothetical protein